MNKCGILQILKQVKGGRVQGNKKGIFTRDRKPKMIAHYLKKRWLSIPDFSYKKQFTVYKNI